MNAMTPRERVLELANAAWTTQVLGAACELGLPDHLAAGTAEATALAVRSGADADAIHRLLRAMAALGLCREEADGRFSPTPEGALLASGHPGSLGAWSRMSARRLWRNWGELAESVRSGRSARARHEDADDFTFFDRDPDGAAEFNRAMVDLSRPVALATARELDWGGVGRIVDVGGGAGVLAAMVLAHHPSMTGVVFDLPHAVPAALRLMEEAGVAIRAEVRSGSFFDAVPAGADAYLLKSVLHNWGDEPALRILRRCAEAMAPGGRVVLVERLLPDRVTDGRVDREAVRSDLNMLVGCGGRERTRVQFEALVAAAGLNLRYVQPLAGGFYALVAVG